MKTAILKICSAVSFLVLMTFPLVSSAAAPADDDAADFGLRAIRITNACDPEVPAPLPAEPTDCATVHPDNNWSFDISWFDPVTGKYYLADRDNFGVDIVDTTNDTLLGVATGGFVGVQPGSNTSGPNGVLVTTKPHQLWAGDGNSHVLVFSLDNDGLPIAKIGDLNVGGSHRSDELAYDPDDQLILIANDDDTDLFLTFIGVSANPNQNSIGNKILLKSSSTPQGDATGCGIEQPVYDHETRRFYVAVPCTSTNTNGEILVLNPTTQSVDTVYALPKTGDSAGCFPHGLALGPRENLLLGCSADNPATGAKLISLIIDATTGNILQTFNQVGGSDEVWYNPGDNNYYLAASNFTKDGLTGSANNAVLGIIDAGSSNSGPEAPAWIQNVKTGAGAHSVAAVFDFKGKGNRGNKGTINPNKTTDSRVYVPLRVGKTIVCKTLEPDGSCSSSNISTVITESGGIGVVGRIP